MYMDISASNITLEQGQLAKEEPLPRSGHSVPSGEGEKIERSILVEAPRERVYAFWRDLSRWPKFVKHLQSVTLVDSHRSHWVVQPPGCKLLQWDTEIINERAPEMFAWRSLEGADVVNAGSVWFEPVPGGSATSVKFTVEIIPPGVLTRLLAKLYGQDPETQIEDDLKRFKALMETGLVPADV